MNCIGLIDDCLYMCLYCWILVRCLNVFIFGFKYLYLELIIFNKLLRFCLRIWVFFNILN